MIRHAAFPFKLKKWKKTRWDWRCGQAGSDIVIALAFQPAHLWARASRGFIFIRAGFKPAPTNRIGKVWGFPADRWSEGVIYKIQRKTRTGSFFGHWKVASA
jgi:hypothetical protein